MQHIKIYLGNSYSSSINAREKFNPEQRAVTDKYAAETYSNRSGYKTVQTNFEKIGGVLCTNFNKSHYHFFNVVQIR